jgi:hypothetical protein
MYRINHLPPEQMPSHQRDFPHRDDAREALGTSNSGGLLLLVLLYLLAMFVGILLLGALTPTSLNTNTAAIGGRI